MKTRKPESATETSPAINRFQVKYRLTGFASVTYDGREIKRGETIGQEEYSRLSDWLKMHFVPVK